MLLKRGSHARLWSWRALVVVATPALLFAAFALSACGSPAGSAPRTPTSSSPSVSTASATALATATAPVFSGTPSPLRTPTLPMDATCFLVDNQATQTATDLAQAHGVPRGCDQFDRLLVIEVPGGTSDPRPGFLACTRPPAAADPYCGAGLGPVVDRTSSYTEHWQFLPFPATDAKSIGNPVDPQLYQCVGSGSQLWTFHFDTLTYTPGCNVVDFSRLQHVPCDVFLYAGTASVLPLYRQHGKATACATFGNTVVGVLAGNPQPGPVVCDAPSSSNPEGVFSYCGLGSTEYPPMTTHWQFIPLPVASGPVTGATFDTAAGTACISAAGQSFTFTVATRAVTPGCAGAPAATATP